MLVMLNNKLFVILGASSIARAKNGDY